MPSSQVQARQISHERRVVQGLATRGIELGKRLVDGTTGGVTGVILTPPSALRATSPLNVAACVAGRVAWALPLSPQRLVLTNNTAAPAAQAAFCAFWDEAIARLHEGPHGPAAIWDPDARVGDTGVELGASGGHRYTWVEVCAISPDRRLLVPLSARADQRPRPPAWQAWLSRADLLHPLTDGALLGQRGHLFPKDGAAELNHFAVLPLDEGWTLQGRLGEAGVQAVRSRFLQWLRLSTGEQLWRCPEGAHPNHVCDACAGRD